MTMIFFFQKARWSCVDFPSVENISKKYIRMTSIIRASKLQQQGTSKWCGNSSISTCSRWFDLLTLLVRTKLILVSTQNHHCFNIKFWRCFSVDKMVMFRRSNADLFNVNIKIITSWASSHFLESTQNQRCFNVKFRRWFNVDMLFRRWNTVIFSTLI